MIGLICLIDHSNTQILLFESLISKLNELAHYFSLQKIGLFSQCKSPFFSHLCSNTLKPSYYSIYA